MELPKQSEHTAFRVQRKSSYDSVSLGNEFSRQTNNHINTITSPGAPKYTFSVHDNNDENRRALRSPAQPQRNLQTHQTLNLQNQELKRSPPLNNNTNIQRIFSPANGNQVYSPNQIYSSNIGGGNGEVRLQSTTIQTHRNQLSGNSFGKQVNSNEMNQLYITLESYKHRVSQLENHLNGYPQLQVRVIELEERISLLILENQKLLRVLNEKLTELEILKANKNPSFEGHVKEAKLYESRCIELESKNVALKKELEKVSSNTSISKLNFNSYENSHSQDFEKILFRNSELAKENEKLHKIIIENMSQLEENHEVIMEMKGRLGSIETTKTNSFSESLSLEKEISRLSNELRNVKSSMETKDHELLNMKKTLEMRNQAYNELFTSFENKSRVNEELDSRLTELLNTKDSSETETKRLLNEERLRNTKLMIDFKNCESELKVLTNSYQEIKDGIKKERQGSLGLIIETQKKEEELIELRLSVQSLKKQKNDLERDLSLLLKTKDIKWNKGEIDGDNVGNEDWEEKALELLALIVLMGVELESTRAIANELIAPSLQSSFEQFKQENNETSPVVMDFHKAIELNDSKESNDNLSGFIFKSPTLKPKFYQ